LYMIHSALETSFAEDAGRGPCPPPRIFLFPQ
jgi:hypothetical protein